MRVEPLRGLPLGKLGDWVDLLGHRRALGRTRHPLQRRHLTRRERLTGSESSLRPPRPTDASRCSSDMRGFSSGSSGASSMSPWRESDSAPGAAGPRPSACAARGPWAVLGLRRDERLRHRRLRRLLLHDRLDEQRRLLRNWADRQFVHRRARRQRGGNGRGGLHRRQRCERAARARLLHGGGRLQPRRLPHGLRRAALRARALGDFGDAGFVRAIGRSCVAAAAAYSRCGSQPSRPDRRRWRPPTRGRCLRGFRRTSRRR